jgi:hypothetical protein
VADRGVLEPEVVADRPNDHLAGVEPDPNREVEALRAAQLARVLAEVVVEVKRGEAGAAGVVLVREWRAEQGHRTVAREFVDCALEPVDAVGDDREEAVHDPLPGLGVGELGEPHRADHVCEQDRHLLALTLELGPLSANPLGEMGRHRHRIHVGAWLCLLARVLCRTETLPAAAAEVVLEGIFGPALGTGHGRCEPLPAGATEPRPGRARVPARGALNWRGCGSGCLGRCHGPPTRTTGAQRTTATY